MRSKVLLFVLLIDLWAAYAAHAIETFASTTDSLSRGTFPGSFAPPNFYGGSIFGSFPVVLDQATARASVLGVPDGRFLSLPGGPGVIGTGFQGAYVEVGFGSNFGANTLLRLYELGDDAERAQLFLWTNTGGNIQPVVTTNPAGVIGLNLSIYTSVLASMGATSFTKVGIGGRDELGVSKGFDLDAVSITPIPEASTVALLTVGLLSIAWANLRQHRA